MKFPSQARRGFTLIELLLAVAITSVVVLVLVSLTGVVADSWTSGNNKMSTNTEARAAFNRLAEDLESAVIRDTIPNADWLAVVPSAGDFSGVEAPANPTWLMFYTTPTDRQLFEYKAGTTTYDTAKPVAGNVITVSYKIVPQDPVAKTPTPGKSDYMLYGLYRAFPNANGLNPAKETFDKALGTTTTTPTTPLLQAFWKTRAEVTSPDNFFISNIFEFSFTFTAAVYVSGAAKTIVLPTEKEIHQTTEGLYVGAAPTTGSTPTYPGGKLAAVDITMTILTRDGARLARLGDFPKNDVKVFTANPKYARTFSHRVYFSPEVTRTYPR